MNVLTPCGQIMDVLRSCYKGKMRFRESDSPVSVTWFFADINASVFSDPTIFRGSDFESTPFNNSGLGDQRPPRGPWRNGMRPALLNGKREHSHYPADWWRDGIPDSASTIVTRLPTGEPILCLLPGFGVRWGGVAKVNKGRWPGFGGGALFGGEAVIASGMYATGGTLFDGEAIVFP